MDTISAKLLPTFSRAAELRADGTPWAKVAAELKRSIQTCKHWPHRYPETWRRLFRAAMSERAAEGGTEAQVHYRILLRNPDPRISLQASRALQRAWEEQMKREDRFERPDPAQATAEIVEFVRYLKGLTDEQLAQHLAEYLARRPAVAAEPADGTADQPGPDVLQ